MKNIYLLILFIVAAFAYMTYIAVKVEKYECMDYQLLGSLHETCLTDGKPGE